MRTLTGDKVPMLLKYRVMPSAGDLPARPQAGQKVGHQSGVLSNVGTGLMGRCWTDGQRLWECHAEGMPGGYSPGHCLCAGTLHVQKACEERDLDSPNIALQRKESCDGGG